MIMKNKLIFYRSITRIFNFSMHKKLNQTLQKLPQNNNYYSYNN
jgi:hypothetical protein